MEYWRGEECVRRSLRHRLVGERWAWAGPPTPPSCAFSPHKHGDARRSQMGFIQESGPPSPGPCLPIQRTPLG